MSLGSEFKEFAMKGNVIDLAVGVVIGAAFGKIVASLVGDVVMPPLGLVIGNVNFTDLAVAIGHDAKGKEVLWRYGAFIQTIFEFLIIALVIVPHHQGHQPPQAAAAGACARRTAADPHRAAVARDQDELAKRRSRPARARIGAHAAAICLNASRVRFSQPVSVIATLSSMRMPPNLRRLATLDQLILPPRVSARAASNN